MDSKLKDSPGEGHAPGSTGAPDAGEMPELSEASGAHAVPAASEASGVSEGSGAPEASSVPGTPGVPGTSGMSGTSEVSGTSEASGTPVAPDASEALGESGTPAAPTSSGASGTPVFDFRKHRGDDGPTTAWALAQPVFFVGFMGAGKTSVARKLARSAGVAAVDMDTYIERRCQRKVSEIFAESGEAGFRAIETDVLRELAEGEPRLVSCGGGVVLAEDNRRILREGGFVVYLRVTAEEAASRISDVSTRPLFGDLAQARRVIEGRLALYEEVADIEIDTNGRGTGSISREVFGRLTKAGVLRELAKASGARPDAGDD